MEKTNQDSNSQDQFKNGRSSESAEKNSNPHKKSSEPVNSEGDDSPSCERELTDDSVEKENTVVKEFLQELKSKDPELVEKAEESFTIMRERYHSGPLPSPEVLANYEQVLPGLADRIVSMAEFEQRSRIGLNYKIVDGNSWTIRWGQIFALILGLSGMFVSYRLIMMGHDWGGALFGSAALASLIGPFLKNWWQSKSEEKGKEKILENPPNKIRVSKPKKKT